MASQNDFPWRVEVDSKIVQVEEPAGGGKQRARVCGGKQRASK